ncbi:MAG: SRPBCC domain-containing protein [Cyclobacteriaceae bacterium]
MNALPPIQVERRYQRPIQEVWEIVTNQKYLTQWLMPGNFEPTVGKEYRFDCEPDDDCPDYVFGEVLSVNEPSEIRFTWKSSHICNTTIVSFILEETEGEVVFKIEHEGFVEQDTATYKQHIEGWAHHQSSIEKLEGYVTN